MSTDIQTQTTSLFIEGRLWLDKTYGNTYYSSRVYVNGKHVFTLGMSYGYDLQFLHDSLKELKERGYINNTSVWQLRDEQGVAVYHSSSYVNKRELFKAVA